MKSLNNLAGECLFCLNPLRFRDFAVPKAVFRFNGRTLLLVEFDPTRAEFRATPLVNLGASDWLT